MAAWIFLMLVVPSMAPEPVPTLTVVWHDSGRLFPEVGLPRLAKEIETLFRENGLNVRFHRASENENLQLIPEPRINAVVLPWDDRSFGLPVNTMAATLGTKGEKHGIFVFYPGVRRTLGYRDGDSSPRHTSELARALARVVAHELVHALAPERGHSDSGLMTEKLNRDALLAERIAVDSSTLAQLTLSMRLWSSLRPAPPLS